MPALSSPPFAPAAVSTESDVMEALRQLQDRLNAFQATPPNTASVDALAESTAAAARALMALPGRKSPSSVAQQGLALVRALRDAHVLETVAVLMGKRVVLPSDDRGWPVLIARMLLSESWQCTSAPLLSAVPDWMWGDYARWLFSLPARFLAPHEADVYAAHVARHLAELNRWMKRNTGSAAVRAAAEAYLNVSALVPFQHLPVNVRQLATLRGEFLARYFFAGNPAAADHLPAPRVGRRLTVGFVHARFGSGADLRGVQPAYAQLDSRSFETTLISLSRDDADFAATSCAAGRRCVVLAPTFAERVMELRTMAFDILVFCGDVGTRLDDVTRLASQRLASLQVVNHRTGVTSGLPEIDLYVMGDRPNAAEIAGEFVERLGLVRGPALSFAIPATTVEAAEDPRSALGLPASATLLVSVVTAAGVSRETAELWARILAQAPESRLLIARVADELEQNSSGAVSSFCEALGNVLQAQGVASERVSVFPVAPGAVDEVRTLLRIADVYLNSLAGSDAVWVAEALRLARPMVALGDVEASRSSSAAELLASIEMSELAASDAESYLQLAVKLATNSEMRASLGQRIAAAVESGAGFLDTLAAGEALGVLLETAFDELTALGRAQFRAQREPLRCFAPENVADTVAAGEAALASGDNALAASEANLALRADPQNVPARILRGRVLLAEGEPARAVTYLLAAVERRNEDAELWFTLAQALRQNQQQSTATQALETSLRLDRGRVDGWLMLLEIAESAGAMEIAADAREVLRELAPDDPRVLAVA